VIVSDEGNKSQKVMGGVPLSGTIDSRVYITIKGGSEFKQVAAVVKVKRWDLKPPHKVSRNYNHQPFILTVKSMLTLD